MKTSEIKTSKENWVDMLPHRENVLIEDKLISPEDLDLFSIVDTQEEVLACLENFHTKGIFNPNF